MQRPKFSLLKFLEKQSPVLGDGAKTKLFQKLGYPIEKPLFLANLEAPDLVRQGHRSYLRAGAQLLRSNSEGAHRLALEALDLAQRGEALNNVSMALAQEVKGYGAIVAGSITAITAQSPTALREQAYGEQCIYLADTGANVLLLWDFSDITELQLALQVAKRTVYTDCLPHLSVSCSSDTHTVLQAFTRLYAERASLVGLQALANEPQLSLWMAALVEEYGAVSVILDELPSVEGRISDDFKAAAKTLLEVGVAILMGGHDTTPEHIQWLRELWAEN